MQQQINSKVHNKQNCAFAGDDTVCKTSRCWKLEQIVRMAHAIVFQGANVCFNDGQPASLAVSFLWAVAGALLFGWYAFVLWDIYVHLTPVHHRLASTVPIVLTETVLSCYIMQLLWREARFLGNEITQSVSCSLHPQRILTKQTCDEGVQNEGCY